MLDDAEVFGGDTFVKRGRGRPPTGTARELVIFRFDRDVLARLDVAGPGWRSQVNQLLRTGLGLDQPQAIAAAKLPRLFAGGGRAPSALAMATGASGRARSRAGSK